MAAIGTWIEDDGLAWIEIRRPDKLNALNSEILTDLEGVLREHAAEPAIRVILLTGEGQRAFAAGADIGEMNGLDAAGIRALMDQGKAVTGLLEEISRPVLAVVNGYALGGGCELVLACDLVVASETAVFGLPEVDLAVLPGWGGTQRLERRVGYGRARDMIFTGRRVGAAEALAWGLADRVFPGDRLREEAAALARTLGVKDPTALGAAKEALRMGSPVPSPEGLARETDLFVRLFDRPVRQAAMERMLKRE